MVSSEEGEKKFQWKPVMGDSWIFTNGCEPACESAYIMCPISLFERETCKKWRKVGNDA